MNTNQIKSTIAQVHSAPMAKNAATLQSSRHQKAQMNYQRYLAQARAEALVGNNIEAENYYQHAEHYFRSQRMTDA